MSDQLTVYLIRHGQTQGNKQKRYIGWGTDEPLSEEGIALLTERAASYPKAEILYVSPMLRCRQTASIIYPDQEQVQVPDLRECDFGVFENRSAEEMADDPVYQQWVDSGGTLAFPGGESMELVASRVMEALQKIVWESFAKNRERIALVIHGGVIMSIMCRIGVPQKPYYDFMVENGEGYVLHIDRSDDWLYSGSSSGGSHMDVSSGANDRKNDRIFYDNYQKMFS